MESIEPNNFENQVKNKMDELQIHPPESAWINIEKRISNKGKQRKMVLILFFLSLFLLTGGYWLFNSGRGYKTIANNQLENIIKEDTQKIKVENNDSPLVHSINPNKKSTGKIEWKVSQRKFNSDENIVKSQKHKSPKSLKSVPFLLSNKREVAVREESEEIPSAVVSNHQEKSRDSTYDHKKTLAKNDSEISTELGKYSHEKIGQDSVKNNDETEIIASTHDSVLTGNKKNSPVIRNKWHVGLTFSGGASLIGNDPFGLKNNITYFSDPSNSSTGPDSILNPSPSKIRNSIAFIAGVFFEKSISRRLSVSFGINYKYFSTLSKAGLKIDSIQTAYYNAPTSSRNYRNSFNFLEVPVVIKLLLNNNKSLPLYWQAGMSVSKLISSNALQFKADRGVYYIDNSLFNNTQLGFSSGLSMTIFSKQKYPVNIGPSIYYSVSGIAHDGLYKKKHFSYVGISAEILLGNK